MRFLLRAGHHRRIWRWWIRPGSGRSLFLKNHTIKDGPEPNKLDLSVSSARHLQWENEADNCKTLFFPIPTTLCAEN
jgi:hypothetical protein